MRKQSGFTLIELVIVIIILGILAVTAAPKFLNLQEDARTATLKAVEASLKSASSMVYSKAVLKGKETSSDEVALDIGGGKTVATLFGYPVATQAALSALLDVDSTAWEYKVPETATDPVSIMIYPKGKTALDNCFVTYTQAKTGVVAKVETTDCK
ncbi:MSHA major pilin subunit MshA [Aeromonas diversa CDC 2478-85]|uniref:MSHA major pilin subunit MshA n=1 Tax=Aeromonas diversa CDC 2478-85 TaxID=1268237 RepID=N9U133_9GAMM|nr:prepilin-type N-terminal cleavage/methylation domain-containing protein [Aeromonas diversa]ENY72025.1 MSHA major pilin subunit MshA [Aeromonas diversa CDC 2478-85]